MALDLDPDGLDRVAGHIRAAGEALAAAGLSPGVVPPVGGDEVSATLMANLNDRRRWLLDHVRAGHNHAQAAADLATGNAAAYRTTDTDAAAAYTGGPTTGGTAATAAAATPAPPPTMPSPTPIPDISGRDGEDLARALESGAGPQPATAAAGHLTALAGHAAAAATHFDTATTALAAAGHSDVHAPLSRKLLHAAAWSTALAAHAEDLANGYTSAAATHAATYAAVGPSAGWQALKTGYQQAIAENIATGGLAQNVVDAYQTALSTQQQNASTGMAGYQGAGQAVSTPPGTLPDPSLAADDTADDTVDKRGKTPEDPAEMLSPILGALGPVMSSAGKLNPLSAAGQAAGQLGQLGQQFANPNALKPAALARHAATSGLPGNKGINVAKGTGGAKGINPGKGIGGGAKAGGGGKGIKAGSAISPHAAVRPGVPATTATAAAAAKAEPTTGTGGAGAGRGTGGGSGMGMMPMSRGIGDTSKSSRVTAYPEDSPADIPTTATAGIAADTTPAEPAVDPAQRSATLARIAKRKAAAATDQPSAS